MGNIANLRSLLERARDDASAAESALRRAERRCRDTTEELERRQRAHTDALQRVVGSSRPAVLEALSYARSAVENSVLHGTTLKQLLEAHTESKSGSAEPWPRLVDELHCFFGFAAEVVRGMTKLRLATASDLPAAHENLKHCLEQLKLAGAGALVSHERTVADSADKWFVCSMQLLEMAPGLLDAELVWVAEFLEQVEADQHRLS